MESRIASLGATAFRGFMAGAAAGGIGGLVATLTTVARSVASIGDEAQRAGLRTSVFQEWKFVAEQARIPMDAIVDAFKELAIRADEFAVTGKGSAAEAFQRIGMTREEVQSKLRDPSALMLEIIERTKALGSTAAGVRIFDEMFGGTGGERMVNLLRQGEGAIKDQIRAANDLGLVIDEDLIERAAELDRQFNIIATTVSTTLKTAIVEAATALQDFIDRFRQVEARQTATLQNQLSEAERNLKAAQGGLGRMGGMFDAPLRKQVETSQAEVDRLRQVLRDRTLDAMRPQLESLSSGGTATKGDRLGYTPPLPAAGGAKGGGSRDRAAAAAGREAEAVRRLIGDLEEELRLVGASDLEREISNALRGAGAAATEEQRTKIVALITALHAEEEAVLRASDAMQEFAAIGRDVLGGFIQDLRSGKSAAEAMENALSRLADRALDMALDSLFGGLNLGSLFGGGRSILNSGGGFRGLIGYSSGTANTGGRRGQPRGVVHGQEAVIPLPNGGRVPVQMQGGGDVTVQINNAPPGTSAREERSRGPDGRQLRRIVVDVVSSEMAGGGFDKPLGARYGTRPTRVAR